MNGAAFQSLYQQAFLILVPSDAIAYSNPDLSPSTNPFLEWYFVPTIA